MEINNSTDFFKLLVDPDYKSFCNNELDVRNAIHAAFSASHMAEWYYNDNKKMPHRVFNKKCEVQFIEKLKNAFVPFHLMRDITNAYKHVKITKGKPKTLKESPLEVRDLPYPEALLTGSSIAMGEPATIFTINILHSDDLHCDREGYVPFKFILGCQVNLWKILIDDFNSPVDLVVKKLNSVLDVSIVYTE
jgi:hypothetical protein